MTTSSPEVIEKIQTAHLAACVVLLEDFACPLDYLNNQPEDMLQPGLGGATGNKDIKYVHAEPAL